MNISQMIRKYTFILILTKETKIPKHIIAISFPLRKYESFVTFKKMYSNEIIKFQCTVLNFF